MPLTRHQFALDQARRRYSGGALEWASDKSELHQAVANYIQQRQEDERG